MAGVLAYLLPSGGIFLICVAKYYYRPRTWMGKGFVPLCLSVCIRMITFEPLDLLT